MKEDIKLPAIVDIVGYNQKVLIFKCGKAYHLEGDHEGEWSDGEYYIESQCKNITTEYLANTYGKVESKEHAEFIFDLVDINDFSGLTGYAEEYPSWFCFDDDELFFFDNESNANDNGEKLITIPLPPKQIQTATSEEEFEMQQIMKNNGDNLVLGCEDSINKLCDQAAEQILKKKPAFTVRENSDGEEWPQVNDDVLYNGEKCKVMLGADKSGHIVILKNGDYCNPYKDDVQKPKTQDEELFENFWREVGLFMNQSNLNKDIFKAAFIKNITKKP